MEPLPHHYTVTATGQSTGDVALNSANVDTIMSAPPAEFGGSGDRWSPESLLVAAIADCFILSFRGIARASKFDWLDLECRVVGTLDRVDNITQFTQYHINATLKVPAGTDLDKGDRLLHKAEMNCLITNSLRGTVSLTTMITPL